MRLGTADTVLVSVLAAAGLAAVGPFDAARPAKVSRPAAKVSKPVTDVRAPLDPVVQRGLEWLARAQHPDGGWGAGSHANQQFRDPHHVATDPATTAFVAMALLRTGNTPEAGAYRDSVKRATLYLVQSVENSPEEGPSITNLTGTQPQAKLGPYVDTGMTSQFLARVLPVLTRGTPLHGRVDAALGRCVRKLESSQSAQGHWGSGGGWAPVLQSSMATTALEMAQAAGKKVDAGKLEKAREYQKKNYDAATGQTESGEAAGVALYAFSSAQRANAAEAAEAMRMVEEAKALGYVAPGAPVSEDTLKRAGVDGPKARRLEQAYRDSQAQLKGMADEQLLRGFGSNGGEEYLSYLQTSESLVMARSQQWSQWQADMMRRLAKIQSQDGSWTGHHCITSPVFCTAAVLQTLTADRDAASLQRVAQATK